MSTILITVLPVFGMIVMGYFFAKLDIIDAAASRGIGLFVFNVAIPALLFKTMATMDSADVAPWSLWAAYYGGIACTWVAAAYMSRFIPSLNYSGGATSAMAASFGNLAMLGTPLALAHFGQAVALPLGLILSVHAPVLWFSATLHRELARHSGHFSLRKTGQELISNLFRNAIVMALLVGSLWRFTGLGLHPIADKMLTMLADASVPTALFALGCSLSAYSLRGSSVGMFALISLKMIFMPIVVFVFSHFVFKLSPLWSQIAVLFAAMPSGANAFLFAQKNNEGVPAISSAIALGTGLAAISASVLLYLMDVGVI
ncbi:MAG: AEC family transporter [Alphaproteobacteria bacterium]|nr:AEC family transporter [Alphaproteobacteria bacterium]